MHPPAVEAGHPTPVFLGALCRPRASRAQPACSGQSRWCMRGRGQAATERPDTQLCKKDEAGEGPVLSSGGVRSNSSQFCLAGCGWQPPPSTGQRRVSSPRTALQPPTVPGPLGHLPAGPMGQAWSTWTPRPPSVSEEEGGAAPRPHSPLQLQGYSPGASPWGPGALRSVTGHLLSPAQMPTRFLQ